MKTMKKIRLFVMMAVLCGAIGAPAAGVAAQQISTRAQLASFIRSCAFECRTNVKFDYSSAISANLKDRDWFSQVLFENGVKEAAWCNHESKKQMEFTSLTYCDEFYNQKQEEVYWLTSWAEIEEFARGRSALRDTAFTFFFDAELKVDEQVQRLSTILHSVGMSSFSWSIGTCRVHLDEVVYPLEFALCSSKQEIKDYLSRCARYQVKDFSLYLGDSLFQQMQANHFAGMAELEGDVHIVSRDLSYSSGSGAIHYKNTVYDFDAQLCQFPEDAADVLLRGAESLQQEITLFCTDSLYKQLTAQKDDLLTHLAKRAGLNSWATVSNEEAGRLRLTKIDYYAGFKMLRAYRMSRWDLLSAREYDALVYAINAINQGDMPSDFLGAEKWIHDYLCRKIEYTLDDNTEEDDNAIGALLNGEANCDGYADAFYLMGNLVGMEVTCQFGSNRKSAGEIDHAWNQIKINGEWYLVDLTWNDSKDGDTGYTWYNLGQDLGAQSHWWRVQGRDTALAGQTQQAFRPQPIYACKSYEELKSIVRTCKNQGISSFDVYYGSGPDFYQNSDKMYDTVRSAGARGNIRAVWHTETGFISFLNLKYQ